MNYKLILILCLEGPQFFVARNISEHTDNRSLSTVYSIQYNMG
jgi:hypothetical protein